MKLFSMGTPRSKLLVRLSNDDDFQNILSAFLISKITQNNKITIEATKTKNNKFFMIFKKSSFYLKKKFL